MRRGRSHRTSRSLSACWQISHVPGQRAGRSGASALRKPTPRTSNPIESVFATVRHRTVRTKGALSAKTAKLMVFKLVDAAAKTWRRLKGENQLPKVIAGIKFQNGIEVIKMPAHNAA
jgi:hypothetical protein